MSPRPGPEPVPDDPDRPRELGARGRLAFTVAWCSFLAACLATMVFFAIVDPAPLDGTATAAGASRMTLYSVGFFFFWTACAGSAALTAFMLTTPVPAPPAALRDAGAARRSPN
ncbi:MAG: hypothetical protein MUF07_07660 [Steroidobacteraceae bacterium]|nr:hypothetical protein [Steroidobacteraceae bacterium]